VGETDGDASELRSGRPGRPSPTGYLAGSRHSRRLVSPVVGLPDDPAAIDLSLLAFNELTVRGSLVYDEQDFASALALLAAGAIPCDTIITTVAPLADAPSLIAALHAPTSDLVKVLLAP
jgi:threonine dehydrogenase-like Zn-dependent dehydrogenase